MTSKTKRALIIFIDDENREKVQRQFEGALGQDQQRRLYRAFVEDTIANCLTLADVYLKVHCTKGQTSKIVKEVVKGLAETINPGQTKTYKSNRFSVVESTGKTMGKRLSNAVKSAFDEGFGRVALIGCVTPTLQTNVIENAFNVIASRDLVIGPTHEGSYYLIASSNYVPELFENVDWSNDTRVYSQMVKAFEENDYDWNEMDLWYDLRHPEDLEFLVTDINHFRLVGDEATASRTEAMLEEILKNLPS